MQWVWLVLILGAALSYGAFLIAPEQWATVNAVLLGTAALAVAIANIVVHFMQKRLTLEHGRILALLATHHNGVIAYDPSFKVTMMNDAAAAIVRLPKKEVIGKRFSIDSGKDENTKMISAILFPSLGARTFIQSERGVEPEIVDITLENPNVELQTTTAPIRDRRKRVIGYIKLVRDRSRDFSLAQQKNNFIDIASRQLKEPVDTINQSLGVIEDQLSEGSKPLLEQAKRAGEKMRTILNDLLDIVKIEEGKFGYTFEQVNIIDFVQTVLESAMPIAEQYGVKVYLDTPQDDMPAIFGDRQRLALVFSNLIDNALKYNVENGEVVIRLEKMKDQPFVQVMIKDTGMGIPPEALENIFQKFFRAENAAETSEGSGLGLYIVKNVIARHGGRVWVESELHRGTTFYFTLPTERSHIVTRGGIG